MGDGVVLKPQGGVRPPVAGQHDGLFDRSSPGQPLLPHGLGFVQKSKSARRGNLFQIAAICQPDAEALLANQWMRKVNGISNRIDICPIYGNELISLAQLDLPDDPWLSARSTLSPD